MKCEIEFLAVGEASKAGDAIVIRYGEPDAYNLMLVDGGTTDTGERIVQHIKEQFGEQARLEHVVITHSDGDHASGVREVLRELDVGKLWLHVPWEFAKDTIHLFKDKRWTVDGLTKSIKDNYPIIAELVELAEEAGIPIEYPFEGQQIGPFTVTSPSKYAYVCLLPQFSKTPDPDQAAIEALNMWLGKAPSGFIAALLEAASKSVEKWVDESWENERLKDGGITSAMNETSAVLYANTGEQRVLLTGDAGVNALWWTERYAIAHDLPLKNFTFVQVPHHGSRRNVGPSVLDALLGSKELVASNRFSAFVSAPKDDASHPRKIVLNAFMRRGGEVITTQGTNKVHRGGFPMRPNYTKADAVAFSTTVEDYD
jgi:beta-lactamase superfamily II metal-dependent hydrolase